MSSVVGPATMMIELLREVVVRKSNDKLRTHVETL